MGNGATLQVEGVASFISPVCIYRHTLSLVVVAACKDVIGLFFHSKQTYVNYVVLLDTLDSGGAKTPPKSSLL